MTIMSPAAIRKLVHEATDKGHTVRLLPDGTVEILPHNDDHAPHRPLDLVDLKR